VRGDEECHEVDETGLHPIEESFSTATMKQTIGRVGLGSPHQATVSGARWRVHRRGCANNYFERKRTVKVIVSCFWLDSC
jgi:hypothetical protein